MRPIHLAGGRQRDLYGPVISHRSSICIFMALSSYEGGEGAGRNRRSGRRENGGGTSHPSQIRDFSSTRILTGSPESLSPPSSASSRLGAGGLVGNESTGIYQVPRAVPGSVSDAVRAAKAGRLAGLSPEVPDTPLRPSWSLRSARLHLLRGKKSTVLGTATTKRFCSCFDNIDPSQISLRIPEEVWRRGSEELKLAPLKSCYSLACLLRPYYSLGSGFREARVPKSLCDLGQAVKPFSMNYLLCKLGMIIVLTPQRTLG